MNKQDAIQLIQDVYLNMEEQNHYEFLGVEQDASGDDVRRAYRALVRQFHSDRFRSLELGPAEKMLDAVFQRINTAHATLIDPEQREEYDAELAGGGRVGADEMAEIFEAEDAFRRAKQLLQRGQYQPALEKLKLVNRVNPDDPDSRAHYLFAQFITAPARESGDRSPDAMKALSDLGAIADENNELLSPNLLYAKGMKLLGKEDDARKYFRRVLRIDRDNADAAREIRLMDMREDKETFFDKLRSFFKR